jgi:hypothetical protein
MADTFIKIATVTVGGGGSATIDFTSIPSTYTDLMVYLSGRSTGADNSRFVRIRFNSDSGSNYTNKRVRGDGSTASSAGETSDTSGFTVMSGGNNTASTFGSTSIYIPNYAGTTNKSFSTDAVTENNATGAEAMLFAEIWNNTSAISSITLTPSANNFAQYSTATLYGISKT